MIQELDFVETVFGFGVEDYGAGQDAVGEAVSTAFQVAFGRDRPAGFGAVGACRCFLLLGTHCDYRVAGARGLRGEVY